MGEDLEVRVRIPFWRLAKIRRGETLLFSYILYKSRSHRDKVNAKVMKDTRIAKLGGAKGMPFDVKRITFGNFKVLVEA